MNNCCDIGELDFNTSVVKPYNVWSKQAFPRDILNLFTLYCL